MKITLNKPSVNSPTPYMLLHNSRYCETVAWLELNRCLTKQGISHVIPLIAKKAPVNKHWSFSYGHKEPV